MTLVDADGSDFDREAMKDMKEEARKRLHEFETTTLNELGEDGWTFLTVNQHIESGITTYVYYFSRPL